MNLTEPKFIHSPTSTPWIKADEDGRDPLNPYWEARAYDIKYDIKNGRVRINRMYLSFRKRKETKAPFWQLGLADRVAKITFAVEGIYVCYIKPEDSEHGLLSPDTVEEIISEAFKDHHCDITPAFVRYLFARVEHKLGGMVTQTEALRSKNKLQSVKSA
jgi:hypothetical protein